MCSGFTEQTVSDILLFATHADPQLRGLTSTMIGNFLESALTQSGGNFSNLRAESTVTVLGLLSVLLKVRQQDMSNESDLWDNSPTSK